MKPVEISFEKLLKTLKKFDVEFIVVGGVAAVLQGAPLATFDLDIVHRRSEENIRRLLSALQELHARFRSQGNRQLTPNRSHLQSEGHQLLLTDFGPLDVLGAVGAQRDYEALKTQTTEVKISDFSVHLLNLKTLIQVKEEIGQPKDRAVLDLLRELERESRTEE